MQKREVATAQRLGTPAVLLLLACCAAWDLNQVAIKVANQGISPTLQAGLRSALVAAGGIRLVNRAPA